MKKLSIIVLFLLCTIASKAQLAYNFRLPDATGKTVSLTQYKGKVVFLDFWFTGCINCMKFYKSALSEAEKKYEHDPGLVFISICIDKDKQTWLKSLNNGHYTSSASVNLFTLGQGDQHPVIKNYAVTNYPQPILIGKDGKIITRSDDLTKPEELINQIQNALSK